MIDVVIIDNWPNQLPVFVDIMKWSDDWRCDWC